MHVENSSDASRTRLLLWMIPCAKLVLLLAVFPWYGIFRDELYYLACADHLDWGYVDQPPLSIWILAAVRAVFGDSLFVLRLIPALVGAATLHLIGRLARVLGGGSFAVGLAMIAAFALPGYLGSDHLYSMNAFDRLAWAAAALVFAHLLRGADPRLWLLLGTILGLGLLNKISVLWLGLGLFVGVAATAARVQLKTSWPWLGGVVSMVLFAPYLLWQTAHDWPTLEFIERATTFKMVSTGPLEFLGAQLESTLPALLVWIPGLVWLLVAERGRWRALGLIYPVVAVILILNGASRSSYLGPAYTWLVAAGGVVWEGWATRPTGRRLRVAAATVVVLLVVLFGALLAPLAIPVLPVETYIAYTRALGIAPSTEERKELVDLPQHYADMHGWHEIVDAVALAADRLSDAERASAVVYAQNYGVAGAIDRFGPALDLPPAVSGHNNYWLWGLRGRTPETLIVVGGDREDHAESCAEVVAVTKIDCGHCMPYENGQTVWICRGLLRSFGEIWDDARHFD